MACIRDYVYLNISDAKNLTPTPSRDFSYQWSIPASYYSNQRSSACMVRLLQLTMEGGDVDECMVITTNLACENMVIPLDISSGAGQNQGSSARIGNVLGIVAEWNASQIFFTGANTFPFLQVAPRPSVIELGVWNSNLTSPIRDIDEFQAILEFSYFNSQDTGAELVDDFTPTPQRLLRG